MAISMDATIFEKVTLKVQEVLETKQNISLDEELSNVGLDSLKSVALIVNLEECFDIVFEDEELLFEYFSTIQKIADRVAAKLE